MYRYRRKTQSLIFPFFRDVARTYYRGSACIFLMYDVARRSTFDHIKGWLQDAAGNLKRVGVR